MKTGSDDPIFSLASAPGRAGVSVIRLSGVDVETKIRKLIKSSLPEPRIMTLCNLVDAAGLEIDQCLLVWFKAPHSFTGENVVEFHTHGSPAVVEATSSELYRLGFRQAEPGEFTKRAFQNGKMDLTEAEGLADLIDANTEGQRRQALRQMQGGLKDVYESWRKDVISALAFVEGEIDFPDEEDVPEKLSSRAGPVLDRLYDKLGSALEDSARGERTRHGVDIAIIGAPNAGKSSIINRLAGRDAAIVSTQPGTTRDIVEVQMELAALPVRISDTAGLRDTEDDIEAEGVKRARQRANESDIRIAVIDLSDSSNRAVLSETEIGDFVVLNKSDHSKEIPQELKNVSRETFLLSAQTGDGFEKFVSALEETVRVRFGSVEQAGLTRVRHRECVVRTMNSVEKAKQNLSVAPELAGAELRNGLHAIKELAGETDIEAVLDRVFSSFCIGK